MVDGQHDADDVDGNPEEVDDVVPEGALNQRAGRLPGLVIDVGSHASTEECGAQVDGDAGEPEDNSVRSELMRILSLFQALTGSYQAPH